MFMSIPCRHPALFLTGVLGGISAAACSKEAEPPRSGESVASTAQPSTTDSAVIRTDTSSARLAADSGKPTDTPASKPPAQNPRVPKPSIDPGRKSAKPITVPKPSPAPAPDTTQAAPAAAPGAAQSQWLKYDTGSNTVTFELIAGPFNFNGYTSGAATLVVPPKANVVMNFVNKDGTPHSAQIITGEGPIPNAAVDPAIPRAYTNKVLEGLPQEASDVMRFTVPESGRYRIFCGVPGHGLGGMWIWMAVDPAAKAPSFGPTKS